jgi:hypothetical protein
MHGPIGALIRPKGAFAYQTGVQPREQMARKPCVLKERRLGLIGSTRAIQEHAAFLQDAFISAIPYPERCSGLVCGVPLGRLQPAPGLQRFRSPARNRPATDRPGGDRPPPDSWGVSEVRGVSPNVRATAGFTRLRVGLVFCYPTGQAGTGHQTRGVTETCPRKTSGFTRLRFGLVFCYSTGQAGTGHHQTRGVTETCPRKTSGFTRLRFGLVFCYPTVPDRGMNAPSPSGSRSATFRASVTARDPVRSLCHPLVGNAWSKRSIIARISLTPLGE